MDRGQHEDRRRESAVRSPVAAHAEHVNEESPWALLSAENTPTAVWWNPAGTTIVAAGAVRSFETGGMGRLDRLRHAAMAAFEDVEYDGPAIARPRVIGGMRFIDGEAIDPGWGSFPSSGFFLPRRQVVQTSAGTWLTTIGEREELSKEIDLAPWNAPTPIADSVDPDRDQWLGQVRDAKTEIREARYEKVVLAHSRTLDFDRTVPLGPFLRKLRSSNPSCFVTAYRPETDTAFAAATPERLVTRSGGHVRTDALAGSSKRGGDDEADNKLSNALRNSGKDRLEHDLVVTAISDRLARFGGSIDVGESTIRKLRSVQHLHTPITADYPDPPHVLELVDALHPTPAVGGLPRRAALDAIDRIETIDRGWYAAPIGWFDQTGDGSFAIGIRSARLDEQSARLFAGAGIVEGSDPPAEWAELQLKYRPIRDVFGGE